MKPYEVVQSITNIIFDTDPIPYFAVGTAFAHPSEDEPHLGRILIFSVTEGRQITLMAEQEVKGAVYSLCIVSEGKLLAGINSKVINLF